MCVQVTKTANRFDISSLLEKILLNISYLRYLCLFVYSGVQQILRCVVFLCLSLVYPMFTVSLLYVLKQKHAHL
jgi:hypothetical protein